MRIIEGENQDTLKNTHGAFEYYFRNNEGETIPPEDYEALEEDAVERINELIVEGYVEGELHTTMISDEDEETSYSGWWKVKEN